MNTNDGESMTREDYVSLFPSLSEAIAFEEQALGIGDELLPDCAKAVMDGTVDEPGTEYWVFLASQMEHSDG